MPAADSMAAADRSRSGHYASIRRQSCNRFSVAGQNQCCSVCEKCSLTSASAGHAKGHMSALGRLRSFLKDRPPLVEPPLNGVAVFLALLTRRLHFSDRRHFHVLALAPHVGLPAIAGSFPIVLHFPAC